MGGFINNLYSAKKYTQSFLFSNTMIEIRLQGIVVWWFILVISPDRKARSSRCRFGMTCERQKKRVNRTFPFFETLVPAICSFLSLSSGEPDDFKFFIASHYCCFRSCTGCDTWLQTGVASMTTKPTWRVFGRHDTATFLPLLFYQPRADFFIKAKWNDLVAGKKCLICFSLNFGSGVLSLSVYSVFQMNTTSCYKLVSLWALSSEKTLLHPLLHFLTLSTRPWGPLLDQTWIWVAVRSLIPTFAFTISASARWCCCAWERSQGEPEGRRSWGNSAEEKQKLVQGCLNCSVLQYFALAEFAKFTLIRQ